MTRPMLLVIAALLTIGIGAPAATRDKAPRFAFKAKAITLPEDRITLADSEANERITTNCTACHSVEMITTQPVLDAKTWAAEVAKMRSVYRAPIDPADDAALVTALVALQAQPPAR